MTNHPKHFVRLGILIALLVGVGLAPAQSGAIRDTAAFFSEPSKAEAGRNITELGRRFRKDLVIETFREIPEAVRQGVNLQDKPAVNRMFEQWTVQQAKQLRVNGIYILLTKEPAHLQVVVGNETQNNAFTLKDRDALTSLVLARLRAKQNDEALLDGVNFVTTTMASHAAARTRPVPVTTAPASRSESPSGLSTILVVLLVLAVVWLVVGVFRAMSRSGNAAAGAGGGAVSGGGGFLSSLVGGMFGAAAGMWLYDQFSGNHGSAWGANQDQGSSGEGSFSGRDSDYSSSGSDFSGGDSGGGDSGGGDSGGGDF